MIFHPFRVRGNSWAIWVGALPRPPISDPRPTDYVGQSGGPSGSIATISDIDT